MADKEYIERELAVQAVVDTPCRMVIDKGKVIRAIEGVPLADVVEVVRCKDCRHFCPYDGEEHKGDCDELVGLESCVYEDDYCSYGEAKMDGKGEGE